MLCGALGSCFQSQWQRNGEVFALADVSAFSFIPAGHHFSFWFSWQLWGERFYAK